MQKNFIITDGKDFIGNGFVIMNRYALTCSHIINTGGSHFLYKNEHTPFKVVEDFRNEPLTDLETEKLDLALLTSPIFEVDNEIRIKSDEIERRDVLHVTGYQKGIVDLQTFSGVYNGFPERKYENTSSIFFKITDNKPIKGVSGALVLTLEGETVGLFYGMGNSQQAFYIKIEYIVEKIKSLIE